MTKIIQVSVLALLIICNSACASSEGDYSKWGVTVGRVYKVWEIDGSEVTYEYFVNGNRYSNTISTPSGTVYGDKYLILYNPEKPSKSIIGDPMPFFEVDDSVAFIDGEIIGGKVSKETYKDKITIYFRYRYYVNGQKHERDQNSTFCIEPGIKIRRGMKFKVKYALHNPQSSIMIISDDYKDDYKNVIRDLPCDSQQKLIPLWSVL